MSLSVITPDGSLRNNQLKSQLVNLTEKFGFINEFIFHGVDGRRGDFDDFSKLNQKTNVAILGRKITSTEGACLFSHRNAYQNSNSDWLVVIEDDMEIVNADLFENLLSNLEAQAHSNKPTILLLFVGKNALIPIRRSFCYGKIPFFRALKVPTSTCAYAINRAAMGVALRDSKFAGTADWPTWSHKVKFFLTSDHIFRHLGEDNSLLSYSTNQYRNVWPKFHYSISGNLKTLLASSVPSMLGGKVVFWRLFSKPLILWGISKMPPISFFLSRKNY